MLLFSLSLFGVVLASPSLTFPIAAQYPPVAPVGEYYHFRFAPTTFTSSDATPLTYEISNAPEWLSLDSTARVFSGKPPSGDVGPISFELTASDDTGSTAAQITLLVVENNPVQLVRDISGQLKKFGVLSGPQTLSYTTGETFHISFAPSTFTGPIGMTYAATSADNSPLPSWVNFDAQSITFSGLTPPLSAIPQTFGMRLIATTIEGYTCASVVFNLVINDHRLAFRPFQRFINITKDTNVTYTSLLGSLFLDGRPILADEVAGAISDGPSWLKLDEKTLYLQGKPPPDVSSQYFTVQVRDVYQDRAQAIIHLRAASTAASTFFKGNIGVVKVTIGRSFRYPIGKDILNNHDLTLSLNLGAAASWLHFDQSTRTFYGEVPHNIQPEVVHASITATAAGRSDSQAFAIRIMNPTASTSSISRTTRTSATHSKSPSPTSTTRPLAHAVHGGSVDSVGSSNVGIAIGVTFGIILLVVALLLWSRRRHRAGLPLFPRSQNSGSRNKDNKFPNDKTTNEDDMEKGDKLTFQPPKSPPPQLQFKPTQQSLQMTDESYSQLLDLSAVNDTSQASLGAVASIKDAPKHSRQTESSVPQAASKAETSRHSKSHLARAARRKSGLPTQRMITGLGHGRASNRSLNRLSLSNHRASSRESNSWKSTSAGSELSGSSQINNFPGAPRRSGSRALECVPEDSKRMTVRMVSRSGEGAQDETEVDKRPMEEKRNSYLYKRRTSTNQTNAIFGSGVGGTPPESSSKRSRLRQRSVLSRSRSRSSSVGIGPPAHPVPRVIRAWRESGSGDGDSISTADGSSIYSDREAKANEEGNAEVTVSLTDVLEEGPARWKNRVSRQVSKTGYAWAKGAALQSNAKPSQCGKQEEKRTAPSLKVAGGHVDAQSAPGAEVQQLDGKATMVSDASSIGERAFL